jgi:amino acid adenylation domain-containing protein
VANRARPETEALIGYFVNVVVLRSDLSGNPSFRELLGRVRQTTLDAYDHQEMTLDQVVGAVNPPRDMSRHPLFQVMFALQNIELPQLDTLGLSMAPLEDGPTAQSSYFDLTLAFWQSGAVFRGELNFSTDLFRAETIERMARHYKALLVAAIAQPDRPLSALPLLAEDERQQLLVEWNQTAADYPREARIHQLFAWRAEQTPEAVAVVLDEQRWTYAQLNERANQLARYLLRQGVGPESRVGICLERSPQLLLAVLAVLKAGGAYVPLDPAYTRDAEERLKYVLQDARVSLVLTSSALAASLALVHKNLLALDGETAGSIYSESPNDVDASTAAESLAYVLYTSGSTGRPKGVMVTHRNLVNAYYGWLQAYRLDMDVHAHLQMASFGFDVFGGDMVRALCSGGKLVICPKETLLDPKRLLQLIRRENVDIGEFVPVVMRHLVQYLEDTDQRLDSLRLAIVGSDAWYVAEHKRTLRFLGAQTRLINSYGLTETTIDSSFFEGDASMLPDAALVPIGRPFANVRLYVLDGRMQPVPIGVPGELYIGGDGVSRGYVNAELNAQRFLDDPFVPGSKTRLCRTGDRARWRADGQVEFLGRADNQVKIRGFRIEPGEIEEVLGEHPALAQAAVAPHQRTADDLRLVAYVVGKAGAAPDATGMKRFLARRLPDYMIPSAFVTLDTLPTTASGKVDRKALPAPDWSSALAQGEFVAPRTAVEQQLAAIWSEVLGLDRVGAHNNFFDLGGNSLLALRLVSRVRAAFSVDLPLVTLFTAPTVAELAEQIVTLRSRGSTRELPPIRPISRDGLLPASFAQERYWYVQQLAPQTPINNIHTALSLTGDLDAGALRRSINIVVERHESLRTAFAMNGGELAQTIAPEVRIALPVEDLEHLADKARSQQVRQLSHEQSTEPFDLAVAPLFRVRLLRLGDAEHVLLLTTHHIISDDWSLEILSREVAEVYEAIRAGRSVRLSELPVQYPDYAAWQRNYLQGEVLDLLLGYWRSKLAGMASLQLPTDRPRQPDAPRIQRVHAFQIPRSLVLPLDRLCNEEGATRFMLFLASFQALLHGCSGSDDITVCAPVSNRRLTETLGMIGLFVNTLAFRTDVGGSPSFRELLARVRQTALEAYDHQDLPFERLVKDLRPDRDLTRRQLERVRFRFYQRTTAERVQRRQELAVEFQANTVGVAPEIFDLVLAIVDGTEGFQGGWNYDGTLFDDQTIQRMAADFQSLLEGVAADPDRPVSQLLGQTLPQLPAHPPVQAAKVVERRGGPERRHATPRTASEPADVLPSPSFGKSPSLVPLRTAGSARPLFCIHGLGGHVAAFLPLARGLSNGRPIYGLQAQGLDPGQEPHDRIETMAAWYIEEMREIQPQGPYLLVGWSMGGLIALDAAQQLLAVGQEVALLAMLDTYLSLKDSREQDWDEQSVLHRIAPQLNIPIGELKNLPLPQQWDRIAELANHASGVGIAEIRRLAAACQAHLLALSRYEPRHYVGPCLLFPAESGRSGRDRRWKALCPELCVEPVPGDHSSMLREPYVRVLAERLGRYMQMCDGDDGVNKP